MQNSIIYLNYGLFKAYYDLFETYYYLFNPYYYFLFKLGLRLIFKFSNITMC